MYIIDKFNAKTIFLNSCAFMKEVLYIRTKGVVIIMNDWDHNAK
jgi:hypothetical protein